MTTPPRKPSSFFNAHHAPAGAFCTFTLGFPGAKGGLGLELGGPANESVFVGLETRRGGRYEALPFFAGGEDASKRFDVSADNPIKSGSISSFPAGKMKRDLRLGSDTWRAGDLTFTIHSPVKSVPEPGKASRELMMRAIVPAVFAEITVDNTNGGKPRKMFLGYEGGDRRHNMRRLDDVSGGRYTGIGQGPHTAIVSNTPGVYSGLGFTMDKCLAPDRPENLAFGLGGTAALMAVVPRGKKRTYRFAICFHRGGVVTTGLEAKYYYTRYFRNIEAVAQYALTHWTEQKNLSLASDRLVEKEGLNEAQQFQLCHAVRSYYGSTEFLEVKGEPYWVVNEGEYRMMNTFDLTVDHLFFELAQNPWVVRNQLDWFVNRYAYRDRVRLPGDPREYPGGISFTHDMGVGNCMARPGHSAYEQFGLSGCFSHMTHEQLVNWVCCAASYIRKTNDKAWLRKRLPVFRDCLASMVNRDHPDPAQRDGIMSTDSSRCMGGAEITTYDSLDASLGQARNNLYLAVKSWAAYVGLRTVFGGSGDARHAKQAGAQAGLCARTLAGHLRGDGFIPAVMEEKNESRIIPAIEGLAFPLIWGDKQALNPEGEFGFLIAALAMHLETVLVPGVCKFEDGGWRLSSTNDNSWLSKIYLCQHVARVVFGMKPDPAADEAHRAWLLDPENAYFAWSDQMVAGKARGSKYYPRGVTSWLWLGLNNSNHGSRA